MKLTEAISIRIATADDASSVARLAALDSTEVPGGLLLLAEREGRLAAALSLQDGTTIADPFAPTAELLTLLQVRAARLQPRPKATARLRHAITSRRSPRAHAA